MNIYIEKNKCDCCNRSDLLHIGKASYWREFTFKWNNYLYEDWATHLWMESIMSYKDIKKAIKKCKIKNEYWEYMTEKEFLELVKSKKWWKEHDIISLSHIDDKWYFLRNCEFC